MQTMKLFYGDNGLEDSVLQFQYRLFMEMQCIYAFSYNEGIA